MSRKVYNCIIVPARNRDRYLETILTMLQKAKGCYNAVYVLGGDSNDAISMGNTDVLKYTDDNYGKKWNRGRVLNLAVDLIGNKIFDKFIICDVDCILHKDVIEGFYPTDSFNILGGACLGKDGTDFVMSCADTSLSHSEIFKLPVTVESAIINLNRNYHGCVMMGPGAWRKMGRFSEFMGEPWFEEFEHWGCEDSTFIGKAMALEKRTGSIKTSYFFNAFRHLWHEPNPEKPVHFSSNETFASNQAKMNKKIEYFNERAMAITGTKEFRQPSP